ncbi:NlpC/P60 family protein [Aurantimonas sp. 22II-16-19i]|uniref:C40 family peptidase n=1 Tax=Aurantimonas sp. 22II-16-19i TaxID=1317114 RepID=UPI0009F7A69D|nr:NlpC/P60 family protein [Aurantimonas sp. 22II-16-19i]ORE93958.1 NLP/P60 protein [Aurantimonas sp. 22II-16-19i]
MSADLDARRNAFRPDLADMRLKGRVEAERFVEGEPRRIAAPIAPLRRRPAADAPLETELLMGERVRVFEETGDGWCWAQAEADGYVGYLPAACLGPDDAPPPTARVAVPRTLVFPGPDIKRPPLGALPMGALVAVTGTASDHNADYAELSSGGHVVRQHLAPLDALQADFVAVAERFVAVPYLWGGKSALGIDCSGLVQLALQMTGVAAPRDTDMQERELGTRLAGIEGLRRGDLVFWKGHVGIMLDGQRLLHANAHHMMTAIEPLQAAVDRLAARGAPVTSIRRLRAV